MNTLFLTLVLATLPFNDDFRKCDSVINEAIDQGRIPGAVLCVTKKDRVLYEKAYGYKSVIPVREPMDKDVIFDLASLTKCLGTTLCVMKLIEDGKMSPDDKVSDYIPGFRPWEGADGDTVDITVGHLMSHTSGLSAGVLLKTFLEEYGENDSFNLMHFIARRQPHLFKPGTSMKYSCPNFIILGYLVEIVSGEKLCDFAAHNIYEPLGLKSTSFLPLERPIPDNFRGRIAPTELLEDGTLLCGQVHDPPARIANWGNSGNAGLYSDVSDLSVLCRMILDGGKYHGVRVFKRGTIDLMCSVPYPGTGRTLGWDTDSAFSWIRGKFPAKHCICHTGYTGTGIVLDRRHKVAIILLTNRVHPADKAGIKDVELSVVNCIWDALH